MYTHYCRLRSEGVSESEWVVVVGFAREPHDVKLNIMGLQRTPFHSQNDPAKYGMVALVF